MAAKAARKDYTMKSVIRKDEAAVSPVIATILMVAITVVLAAVLYVMVSGLITPVGGNKPLVTFAAVDQSSGNATIAVAGASQSVSPSNYKVNLQVGSNTGSAVAMTVVLAAVLYVMVSGLITPVGGNKPLVTFAAVTQSSGNATIAVAGASQSVSPSNYKVNLQVGSNTGSAVAMPTTGGLFATMTINSVVYRIYWTDIGGEKTVNPGDNFRVTGNNLPLSPAATSYTFYLLWSDGSSIQQSSWSTP